MTKEVTTCHFNGHFDDGLRVVTFRGERGETEPGSLLKVFSTEKTIASFIKKNATLHYIITTAGVDNNATFF